MRLFALAAVALTSLLALAASGCGTPTVVDGPYKVTYEESGGFAGIYSHVEIDSAAKTITLQDEWEGPVQTATLAEADIDALAEALETADFDNLGNGAACAGCSDSMGFLLALEMDGSTHQVTWEMGHDAAQPVADLVVTLRHGSFPEPQ